MRACRLENRETYDVWAETYPPVPHNPLMRAEQSAMLDRFPEVTGKRALDLASGTGRYATLLERGGAASVVSVDFSVEMLKRCTGRPRLCANMLNLPLADNTFDVVVCGLAVGHAPQLDRWTAEVARVLRPGGSALYSDFHPDASAAGMTRSFVDHNERKHTLTQYSHDVNAHREATHAAGLTIDATFEVRVGIELTEAFSGSEEFYRRWRGLPILLVVRAQK